MKYQIQFLIFKKEKYKKIIDILEIRKYIVHLDDSLDIHSRNIIGKIFLLMSVARIFHCCIYLFYQNNLI
jgi:hypothetical protein